MRIVVALLTTLSMLHLTTVEGDLACASHPAAAHAMPGMVMGAESHEGTLSPDEHASAKPAKDCATPTQAHCCEAMASCGVSTTVNAAERSVSPRPFAAATPRLPSAVLESVLTAPEPPPPKA